MFFFSKQTVTNCFNPYARLKLFVCIPHPWSYIVFTTLPEQSVQSPSSFVYRARTGSSMGKYAVIIGINYIKDPKAALKGFVHSFGCCVVYFLN